MAFRIRKAVQEEVNLADEIFKQLPADLRPLSFKDLVMRLEREGIEYRDDELEYALYKLTTLENRVRIMSFCTVFEKKPRRRLYVESIARRCNA